VMNDHTKPPATQYPDMEAMTGLESIILLTPIGPVVSNVAPDGSTGCCTSTGESWFRREPSSGFVESPSAFKSAPAQNTPLDPLRIATHAVESLSNAMKASARDRATWLSTGEQRGINIPQ
jgi:hypothetical protein